MNIKFIIIVLGEPYSTFSEILGKYFKITLLVLQKILVDRILFLFIDYSMDHIYSTRINYSKFKLNNKLLI